MDQHLMPKSRLDDLIHLLAGDGYEVIGPRIEQEAIVYGPLKSARDLPIGWSDEQKPGAYRLRRRDDEAYFGYVVGPHSWKKYLFPPTQTLWHAVRTAKGFEIRETRPDPPRRALLGVRSCELHAIAIQERTLVNRDGRFSDQNFVASRERLFLIAVECEEPGGTCFCTSMDTGPAVRTDRVPLPVVDGKPSRAACDLVLTELDNAFVIRAESDAGRDVLQRLKFAAATADQVADGQRRVADAAKRMGRAVDVNGVQDLLHRNQQHPRWDDVALRCLACANCTMVCPTCFCASVADVTDLGPENVSRVRQWDSCFNPDFAQVHGGNFRTTIHARYRQWLTHKFASWHDQFDVSGCVGCGRCITWCPVGIDVTEEITAIRAGDGAQREAGQ
jgi:formate hydrogenlyase subunit 6/NADH:ubiquinone oxidoreductase subunit I